MRVSAIEGHRNWAPIYDTGPNPLLALETRVLSEKLSPFDAPRFLDVACGPGYMTAQAAARRVGCEGSRARTRGAATSYSPV